MASNSDEGKILASKREGKEMHTGPDLCNLCDDPAIAYCNTCKKYLCHDCKAAHKKQKQTRDHDISDINNTGAASGAVSCLFHSDSEVKIICETCKAVCCDTCITEKHTGHRYQDISGYARHLKDLCLDEAKHLQEPYDWMVATQGTSKASQDALVKQYEDVKGTLHDRKHLLIQLITTISDEEIAKVSKTQSDVNKEYKEANSKMDASVKRCEQVLTPVMSVVMGRDINLVVRCLQQLDVELDNALVTKRKLEGLDNKPEPRVTTLGDNFAVISDIVKMVFKVEENDASKAIATDTKGVKKTEVRQSNNQNTNVNYKTVQPQGTADGMRDKTDKFDTSNGDRKIETPTSPKTPDTRPVPTYTCSQCGKKYASRSRAWWRRCPLDVGFCSIECYDKYLETKAKEN